MARKTDTAPEKLDWWGALCGLFWLGLIAYVLWHAQALAIAVPAFACIFIAKMVGALRE